MSVIVVSLFGLSILLLIIVVVVALVCLLRGGRGNNCGVCGYPLRRDWKLCPMCGAAAASAEAGPILGDQRKSRLRIFLGPAVVVCVPVALCVIMGIVMMPGINNHPTSGIFTTNMTRETLGDKEAAAFLEVFDASGDGETAGLEKDAAGAAKASMWIQTEKGDEWNEHVDYFLLYIDRDDLEFVNTDDSSGVYGFALQSVKPTAAAKAGKNEKAAGSGSQHGYIIIGRQGYVGRSERTLTIDGVSCDVEIRDAGELPFDLKGLVQKNL